MFLRHLNTESGGIKKMSDHNIREVIEDLRSNMLTFGPAESLGTNLPLMLSIVDGLLVRIEKLEEGARDKLSE